MEAPPVERRLVAILAADVEGYSRLMHGDEEATMATLSARRALVDQLIGRHRGRIANTAGDSVLAEFVSVLDAVHCAVEIQGELQKANEGEPEERQMRFRIGVNVGDVMAKEGDFSATASMSLLGSRGWSGAARSACHEVYVIICDTVAAFFSRIWASSWSKTSLIRSEPFGSASARGHPNNRRRTG